MTGALERPCARSSASSDCHLGQCAWSIQAGGARAGTGLSADSKIAGGREGRDDGTIVGVSPTVLREGPYRFFFFSSDRGEPRHIHVIEMTRSPSSGYNQYAWSTTKASPLRNCSGSGCWFRSIRTRSSGNGMPTSALVEAATARHVRVTGGRLVVDLRDGRQVSVPVAWYPRLAEGTPAERRRWELIGTGVGIHWPDLDEDIEVEALLLGLASNESPTSLRRWRASRRPANKRMEPTRHRRGRRAAHS
jgi:hypothetical protein